MARSIRSVAYTVLRIVVHDELVGKRKFIYQFVTLIMGVYRSESYWWPAAEISPTVRVIRLTWIVRAHILIKGAFSSFKIPKLLQDYLLHRIFRRMHEALNIDKKITNYTVWL
jgi:hypothetical protein